MRFPEAWRCRSDPMTWRTCRVDKACGRPETLALMTANRLSDSQRAKARMLGMRSFAAGHGFGLGVAVVTDPDRASFSPCGGGLGAVGWPGAYGGWWRADPSNDSVLIFL